MTTFTALTPIENISEVIGTLDATVASSTREAYVQELKTLNRCFVLKGWKLYPLDADGQLDASRFTQQVLSYLQERKSEVSLSTINKTLSAIKHDASRKSPHALGLLNGTLVSQFVSGLIRTHRRSEEVRKAEAFTVEQLSQLHDHLRQVGTVRAARDRALLSISLAAALRASNVAELRLKDITCTRTYDGVLLCVRFSKTDQEGNGVDIPVKAAPSSLLCPVKALNIWLGILKVQGITSDTHPDFPLFPILRGQQIKETAMKHPAVTITRIVRDSLVDAGISTPRGAAAYSSHSLRSTFITLSSQQQIPAEQIARISQHKGLEILRGYDRTAVEAFGQVAYLASE